jgi:outer membrane receptor protein involved in Fe transport
MSRQNTHMLVRLLLASPAIFGMLSTYAAAQETAAPVSAKPAAARPAPMQQVEVKGQAAAYDARRDDTATKIVVNQEEILRHGDTTLGEVLKRLPGITVGGAPGRGGDVRMRGLGSGYTQILLNGEPAPPGFSLDQVSPEMVERIEIMRAATAEYSTQAIAGGINIVLKRQVQTAQRELKTGVQVENGAYGAVSTFQLSDKSGKMSYAMSGNLLYGRQDRPSRIVTQGYDAAGREVLHREAFDGNRGRLLGIGLSPRINWNIAPGEVITSQNFINIARSKGDAPETVVTSLGAPPRFVATGTDAENKMEMLRSDLSWTRRLLDGAKLDAKFGVNYAHRDSGVGQRQYYPNAVLAIDRDIDSDFSDKGWSSTGKYARPIGKGHAIALGWDGAYSLRNETRLQNETTTVGAPISNRDESFDATVRRIALFAQDEWSVTQQWSVYFGLRWEGIQIKSEGNSYAAIDNRSSVFSPLFQTLYKIPGSKNDQIRGGITRTYKAPNVASLVPRRGIASNNSPTTPDTMGNPKLKPELAWGLDLAYEHYLPGGGLLSASTYVRHIDDITHSRVFFIDGLWVSMPVNDGAANTRGIELEAKLPLRQMFPGWPALDLRANVSRSWSSLSMVPGPNNRLDQQTPLSGTFGFDYKFDRLPVTFGGSYSFQNGGPVRISQNQYAYAGVKRAFDLYGVLKFTPKVQLRTSLANTLRKDYVNASTYVSADGSRLTDTTFTPTFLQLRAMLETKF